MKDSTHKHLSVKINSLMDVAVLHVGRKIVKKYAHICNEFEWLLKELGGCNFKNYDFSPLKIHPLHTQSCSIDEGMQ